MSGFFKKTLGLFVEFEDEQANAGKSSVNSNSNTGLTPKNTSNTGKPVLSQSDFEKFEKHFEKLFEQANLPGPDYFEFCKMMETLEAHIPDEKARISAVFASLSIQGLTKSKLVESAQQYKLAVLKDKAEFEAAAGKKASVELDSRKKTVEALEKKITENSELIQRLTKEISEAQVKIGTLKGEITEEEGKLLSNKNGYTIASDAMQNKITRDIEKLQTIL